MQSPFEVDQVRLELVSKSYAGRCKQQDPWYGGKYDRAPLEALDT